MTRNIVFTVSLLLFSILALKLIQSHPVETDSSLNIPSIFSQIVDTLGLASRNASLIRFLLYTRLVSLFPSNINVKNMDGESLN